MKALSYSALNEWDECNERFRRTRLTDVQLPRETTQNMSRGTIVHKWLERMMQLRIDHDWPDIRVAEAMMNEVWHDGFVESELTGFNPTTDTAWQPDFLEKSITDSLLLIPKFYDDILPTLDPLASEQYLSIDLPKPGEVYTMLHGRVDCIAAPNFIIDWKTKGSGLRSTWLEYDLQATVYAALSGMDRVKVQFVNFIYLKRDNPRIEVVTTTRDHRHVDWLLNTKIPAVIRAIENNIFNPAPGWWCENCPVKCGAFPDLEVKEF